MKTNDPAGKGSVMCRPLQCQICGMCLVQADHDGDEDKEGEDR